METMQGVVTTGTGKGAYYMGMDVYQERFNDILGFYPYPGTLNLEVDVPDREMFQSEITYTHMDAPERDGERLSAVDVYPVLVDGEIEGALLDLEITDHPASIVEVIAPINLREELGLEDGDTVVLTTR